MAREKKPNARSVTVTVDNGEADDENLENNTPSPEPKAKAKQPAGSGDPPEDGVPEGDPEPVIYAEPVYGDDRRGATPLAATAFARFDKYERKPQLSEHFVYQDREYSERGHF